MIVAALSLSIFAGVDPAASAEPPKAREVLERAREAMTPPVQFRMRVDGVESTVSQKEIGEQGLAVRTETVAPGESTFVGWQDKQLTALAEALGVSD
jgi:hypothetical protein